MLTFREMSLSDIPFIVEIEQRCFSVPWSKDSFYNELTNNRFANYIVAEKGGCIAGYGGMWVILDEAHITNVAVHPDYQGQKIGTALMKQLMAKAAALGAVRMTLEVRRSNRIAKKMYENLGFSVTGIRPGYYSDNGEDALIMWVDLDGR